MEHIRTILDEIVIINRETAKMLQENAESMKATDVKMEETDARMKETDVRMKETDRKLDKLGRLVGSVTNNQGDVAEEFFYNTISAKASLGNINYDFSEKNVTRHKGNIQDEFDILLVNGKDVAIIETKYKAHINDLDRLINKKYVNFKKLYPEYSEYNHHLGLASFYITDNVKEEALSKNVMILQRKGDLIETFLP